MPFPQIDPVAFAIGPFVVRWYALAYLGGILIGAWYGARLLSRRSLWANNAPPFKPDEVWDFAFYAMLGIVIGGRLGYVLFYNLPYYLANPFEAFAVWDGGMAFHGGTLGLIVAVAIFTRAKGGNVLSGFDLIAAVGTIGIFLGRVSNFINAELYGAPTDLPWGVVFPTDPWLVPRHPSQLYEALLEGLLLFLVIRFLTHRRLALRQPGLVGCVFLIGYGLSRILVEFVRLPDAQIGYLAGNWLTMGQVLSLPMVLVGLVVMAVILGRRRA